MKVIDSHVHFWDYDPERHSWISEDMKAVAGQHLTFVEHHRVLWSAFSTSRQSHKTRGGNYEDLWIFTKE